MTAQNQWGVRQGHLEPSEHFQAGSISPALCFSVQPHLWPFFLSLWSSTLNGKARESEETLCPQHQCAGVRTGAAARGPMTGAVRQSPSEPLIWTLPVCAELLKALSEGVPFVAQRFTNPTRIHEDAGSIPGLAQWL